MKLKASIFAAVTTALIASSHGQIVIDITGSTAGRSAVDTQIKALLTGETLSWNGGTGTGNCVRGLYKGATFNGTAVIVRTCWTGSAAGVRDVANAPQLNNQYLTTTAPAGAIADGASLAPASPETVSEIGFSDVFQSSTAFTTNTLVQEDSVGVIKFKFFKNDNNNTTPSAAKTALTNITPPLARALYSGIGELKLSLFTGNTAHSAIPVYCTGRNDESGTRITELAETGTGVFATLAQYTGTISGETATLTYAGNGGFSSGGNVKDLLTCDTLTGVGVNPNGILVSYLGFSDWALAEGGGAEAMTYNGVAFSDVAIQEGQYSFWGYLHQSSMDLTDPVGDPTGVRAAFYTALKDGLLANPGTGLVRIQDMKVERAADGAPITPL